MGGAAREARGAAEQAATLLRAALQASLLYTVLVHCTAHMYAALTLQARLLYTVRVTWTVDTVHCTQYVHCTLYTVQTILDMQPVAVSRHILHPAAGECWGALTAALGPVPHL